MHDCEEFRERITGQIIDREDLTEHLDVQRELLICRNCADFYAESREMIEAISSVDFALPEGEWSAMTHRLRLRILSSRQEQHISHQRVYRSFRVHLPMAAGLAALMVLTVALYRLVAPLSQQPETGSSSSLYLYVDRALPLDPVTVDFLEESELLLRNVMKLAPKDTEDLVDAKKIALGQLVGIEQRKDAAADVLPVLNVMETYETILRDLRNLDEQAPAEDISGIQNRIKKNALIANMKALQPNLSLVSFGR
ncbi:MAG: hypothetical protein DMG13_08890 [Acidobacteria bacterium]|nr:MAG: hypothetical protein DMG13_08890 [Acidobacteriota bacterium]